MRQLKLFLFLLVVFLFQGTVYTYLPVERAMEDVQVVPCFLLVSLLLIAFFIGGGIALRYAILFGFLVDLVYTPIIGAYAFSLALTVYLVHSFSRLFNKNLATVLMLVLIGVVLLQLFVYGIYTIISLIDQPFMDMLQRRLPATVMLNGVFTLIVYYPLRKFLRDLADRLEE